MPSPRIPLACTQGTYFLTCTVNRWYYLFDRHQRWSILADSLTYCRAHKGVRIYGYVFMLNHIHLLVSCTDAIGFIRDFKRHTSRALHANIIEKEPSILPLFLTPEDTTYSVWQPGTMPIRIWSDTVLLQKLRYIHHNPVRKQYVADPADWYWSSAHPQSVVPLDNPFGEELKNEVRE